MSNECQYCDFYSRRIVVLEDENKEYRKANETLQIQNNSFRDENIRLKAENEKLRNKAETFEIEKTALWELIADKGYTYTWQIELGAICELSASRSLKELENEKK